MVLGLLQAERLTLGVVLGTDEHTHNGVLVLVTVDVDFVRERFVVETQLIGLVVVALCLLALLIAQRVVKVDVASVEVGDQLVSLH